MEKITSLPLGDEVESMQEKDVLVNTTEQVSDFLSISYLLQKKMELILEMPLSYLTHPGRQFVVMAGKGD